ncbi:hypothetical protein D3C81_1837590 [compost metagenome]
MKLATQLIGAGAHVRGRRWIVEGQTRGQATVGIDLEADVDTSQTFGRKGHVETGRAPFELLENLRGQVRRGFDGGARKLGRV